MRFLILALLTTASILAQDAKDLSEAYEKGRQMELPESKEREQALLKRPRNFLDRTRLIAFYTHSDKVDETMAIEGRRKHLLWFAQRKPDSWLWSQRSYGTAVYESGRLADPEGFATIREVWLEHLSKKRVKESIRDNAASFLELGDRETVMRLIREKRNSRHLGTYFALILLGVTARDFSTGEPVAADPKIRMTPLAQQIRTELEQSSNSELIGGAGFWLSRDGAMLWNRGYTDWDYSILAKSLLAKARCLDPKKLSWFMANPELPKPGEQRGLGLVRVGGSSMAKKVVWKALPEVPVHLRSIKGTVSMDVAVGSDGRVAKAVVISGPSELHEISIKAVEKWVYKQTSVGGIPVAVLTKIHMRYK